MTDIIVIIDIVQESAPDGCIGVLVYIFLSCFLCKFSFLLWYLELFHQSGAHEHQGNNLSSFISHSSLVIHETIEHSGQMSPHLCSFSETTADRETCQTAYVSPPARTSHTATRNIPL